MALLLVTPAPSPGLVTLDQAKLQLGILPEEESEFDPLIGGLILAASRLVQDYTQRRYLPETWEWVLEHWHNAMVLPLAPATDSQQVTINGITYGALDGTTQTLDPAIYWVRRAGPTMKVVKRWFVIWPFLGDAAGRVVINFTLNNGGANAGPTPAVPDNVQHAVKLLVSHFFRNRDAVVGVDGRDSSTELPLGVVNLLYSEMWEQPGRP